MTSPNDPADVFIGYSRRDGQTSPALFATLLDNNSPHAPFMKMNRCFYDARLEAGQEWGEELEKHASGCKVFIALVGPEWLKVLKERRDDEQGITITTKEQGTVTDWVYKELDLALERDDSDHARVQIVCINNARFDSGKAHELFPAGKVRDYFSNPAVQILQYRDVRDNQGFCTAIQNLLVEHHNNPVSSPGLSRQPSLFESIDPWLRFLGRENVWTRLKSQIGVGMPKEATFNADPHLRKSVALLVAYDNRKDEPRELIRGVSHHLYVEGRYERAEPASVETASTDEHWYALNSFAWPANASSEHVLFQAILETLNVESVDRALCMANSYFT